MKVAVLPPDTAAGPAGSGAAVTSAPTTDRHARPDANVLEAALHWGESLLAVRRLKADGELTLGSSDDADLYVADAQLLTAQQQFVVR